MSSEQQETRKLIEDRKILEAAMVVLSNALNALVGACLEDNGKLKIPERMEIMKARALLPPNCKYALSRKS